MESLASVVYPDGDMAMNRPPGVEVSDQRPVEGSRGPGGWLDRLTGLIGRLPGSNTAYCLGLGLLQAGWVLGLLWWTGRVEAGSVPWQQLFSVVITPGLLWTRFRLDRVAGDCMDRFRPVLPVDDRGFERLRHELTTLSPTSTNVVTAAVLAALALNARFAPDSWVKLWGDSSEVVWLVIGPVVVTTVAVAAVSLAQAVHQLVMVDRIHELAGPVDIRRAKTLHAFSLLTALTGMSFLVLASYIVAVRLDLVETIPTIGLMTLAMIPVSIACFLLPMRRMHERLVEAKGRAVSGVEQRLDLLFARVHERVDAGRLDDAEPLKHQIDSLSAELESLRRISTWPWEPSVLTGFLTTLVLPILLWLVQRGLERSGF